MTRVKALISICCLSLLAAVVPASAAPLATPPQATPQGRSALQQVDYERCVWDDGERVCRTYYDDDDDDFDADWDYDYDPVYHYGAPGIVLGFGGVGVGHGRGGFHHGGGYFVRH